MRACIEYLIDMDQYQLLNNWTISLQGPLVPFIHFYMPTKYWLTGVYQLRRNVPMYNGIFSAAFRWFEIPTVYWYVFFARILMWIII